MIPDAPIGVFDSGVGGLSVLRALRSQLPAERFLYLADTGHAPYGERSEAFVQRRAHGISRYFVQQHGVKALVVACNTATAAAISTLRSSFPHLPIVGVEPALKPAAAASFTGHIAVMATRGTVNSARFAQLRARLPEGTRCRVQACDGLASAIEAQLTSNETGSGAARATILALCEQYLGLLGPFGTSAGTVDTLVLGCTHYVFAQPMLAQLLGPEIQIVSTGEPVARQTARLLASANQLRQALDVKIAPMEGSTCFVTTGAAQPLAKAASQWLGVEGAVHVRSFTGRGTAQRI